MDRNEGKQGITRRSFLGLLGASAGALLAGGAIAACAASQGASSSAGSSPAASTQSTGAMSAASSSASTASASSSTGTQSASSAGSKVAVVYFSATGNTRAIAEKLAGYLSVGAQEIVPVRPYSATDLDYNSEGTRASVDARDASSRPELARTPDVSANGVVFLGYPIWWGRASAPVRTYVERAGLAGKTVIPFCTSGSSPIESASLEAIEPNAVWKPGRRFETGAGESETGAWVDGLGLLWR